MRIFLSYANERSDTASTIAQKLISAGHTVFFDRQSLPAGKAYDDLIRRSVETSRVFIFLLSPEAVAPGRYTLTELQFAKDRWPDPSGNVLPVLVVPTEVTDEYLKAVTILSPRGDVAAEVVAAVARLQPRWPMPIATATGFLTIALAGAFVLTPHAWTQCHLSVLTALCATAGGITLALILMISRRLRHGVPRVMRLPIASVAALIGGVFIYWYAQYTLRDHAFFCGTIAVTGNYKKDDASCEWTTDWQFRPATIDLAERVAIFPVLVTTWGNGTSGECISTAVNEHKPTTRVALDINDKLGTFTGKSQIDGAWQLQINGRVFDQERRQVTGRARVEVTAPGYSGGADGTWTFVH